MTNKLSAEDIDKDLMDRDERKPIRKIVDDKLIPIGGAVLGGAAAIAGSLGNVKAKSKIHTID